MGFSLGGIGKGLFGSSPKAGKTNPDQVWSAQSPYLTANYKSGQDLANSQMAAGSQFQQQNQALNSAWQQQLAGSQNPYLTGMASNAMNQISRQFQEQIMPSLLGGGNEAGQLGQEKYAQIQGQAARDAAIGMGEAATNVYGQMAQLGLQGQSNAIGQSEQVMGAPFNPLLNQAKILGAPTVLGQGGTTAKAGTEGLLGKALGGFSFGL
jgi:hypothetical protein